MEIKIRTHKRHINGKTVDIKDHYRKLPKKSDNFRKLWTGDFDNDGIKNIDDRYPFDHKKTRPVNKEISLSQGFKNLEHRRDEYKQDIKELSKKINADKYRVKGMYSIISKQLNKNIYHVQDLGGLLIKKDTRKEVLNTAEKLKKQFGDKITDTENKYDTAKKSKNPYMAYHINLEYNKKPFEIQIKTKKQDRLHQQMHTAYKQDNQKLIDKLRKKALDLYKKGY